MGTDIHLWVEKRREGGGLEPVWPPVIKEAGTEYQYSRWAEEWADDPEGRQYNLFAFLADVRNGCAFAGIVTGEPVQPQIAGRGIPADTCWAEESRYLGDHSYTHATLGELLGLPWDMVFHSTGLVDKAGYDSFKRDGVPSSWSGDVIGRDVKKYEDELNFQRALAAWPANPHIYLRLDWTWQPVKDCAFRRWLDTLVPRAPNGDLDAVRVVMGFDS